MCLFPLRQYSTVKYLNSAIFSTLKGDSYSGLKVCNLMFLLLAKVFIPYQRVSLMRSSSAQLAMNYTVFISPDSQNRVNSSSFCMKMGKKN